MEDVVTLAPPAPARTRSRAPTSLNVLLTGADGYIGSVLTPMLMRHGHRVTGLDTGYYRAGWLYQDGADRPAMLSRDVRSVRAEDLEGYDAVVHLAELSNDPLCEHDPELTFAINHEASVALAENARRAGVRRFVYASSCSIYGAGGDDVKTEESEPNPQTAYAKCKMFVERDVKPLANASFAPTFLRNATAFGASPRQRFDLVLNNLSGLAWTTGKVTMTSDGTPWRPLVHVRDISAAVLATLDAPTQLVSNQVLNVGDDTQNYRIREIAAAVQEAFPDCQIELTGTGADTRSYRVSFGKIREVLPEFECRHDVRFGARQMRSLFEHIGMTPEVFQSSPHTRLKHLQQLLTTGQVDRNFWWQNHEFH